MRESPSGGGVVVARTGDPAKVALWTAALREAGVPTATVEEGFAAAFGGHVAPATVFALLVPRSELARARSIIADCGGAADLAPVPGATGAPPVGWATGGVFLGLLVLFALALALRCA